MVANVGEVLGFSEKRGENVGRWKLIIAIDLDFCYSDLNGNFCCTVGEISSL